MPDTPVSLLLLGGSALAQFFIDYDEWIFWISVVASIWVFIWGLRLNKRTLTVNFTGNHQVIQGLKKGVPYHIAANFSNLVLNIYWLKEAMKLFANN